MKAIPSGLAVVDDRPADLEFIPDVRRSTNPEVVTRLEMPDRPKGQIIAVLTTGPGLEAGTEYM